MISRSNPLRRAIKRTLQHVAARLGPHALPHNAEKFLILTYHRILPSGDNRALLEEPGMMVTPDTFRLHINLVKQNFDVIHVSEWIKLRRAGAELPAQACAITFDDGWADNYEFAYPVLQELQVPATIFLVSDMIGTARMFWPERLARIVTAVAQTGGGRWSHPRLKWLRDAPTAYRFNSVPPTSEELAQLIAHAKDVPDLEIHSRLDSIVEGLRLTFEELSPSLLTWEQVNKMTRSGLIEAGSHSCRHVRLTADTDDSLLEQEIVGSKRHIEERTRRPVKTFCFPNGDYTAKALDMVRKHYEGAFTYAKGWNSAGTDSYLLRRIGVHEDISSDRTAFLARISGWM